LGFSITNNRESLAAESSQQIKNGSEARHGDQGDARKRPTEKTAKKSVTKTTKKAGKKAAKK